MKSKDKNTTKPTEKSATTRSSISKRVSTMIGTLKRFWSAHWPKILSILAVAVFVIGLTFSCGLVNSKAYESFPDGYPILSVQYTTQTLTYGYSIDLNNLEQQRLEDENAFLSQFDYIDGYTEAALGTVSYDGLSAGLELYPPSVPSYMVSYGLRIYGSDLTKVFSSPSISYDSTYSPYSYVDLWVYTPSPDDVIEWTDAAIEGVVYTDELDPETGLFVTRTVSIPVQVMLPTVHDIVPLNVYDIISSNLNSMPEGFIVESVYIDFSRMYQETVLEYPDENPNTSMSVLLNVSRIPSDISRSNFQLTRQYLNTLYGVTGDGSDGSYQQGYDVGYAEGKNVGLTQNLGITRWLTDAGDSVLGMRIFQVHTPHFVDGQYQPMLVDVTLGNILSVFLGGFLLIFILKMFAGG